MTDLSTSYLGLALRSPLVASASPLSQRVDGVRALAEQVGVPVWSSAAITSTSPALPGCTRSRSGRRARSRGFSAPQAARS